MKQVAVEARIRSKSGKGVARKLRGAGQIPGVLYGPKTEPIALSVDSHTFNKVMHASRGEQVLFTLNLKDNGESQDRLALVKELQLHPVRDSVRHIDFYEIFMDQEVEVDVPIAVVGKAKGVEIEQGILEVLQRTVRVSCLPMAIPSELPLDVSDVGLGEALHASHLTPPAGVRLLENPKMPLVTVVAAGAIEEVEAEVEEEEEEAAEE